MHRRPKISMPMLALLALLAMVGCQPSAKDSTDALRQVDQTLLVERGNLRFVAHSQVGRQLAQERGLPCLLFFTAEWCTFCQQMEETVFVDPNVQRLAEEFVCVLVDADREPEVCREFAVRGYPTLQFLSADGRRLHSLVGRQSTQQLTAGMHAALQRVAWLDHAERTRR